MNWTDWSNDMLKIVTDGSADMPRGWAKRYRINILPLSVRFGEEEYFPGVNLSGLDFYRLVREKRVFPKTSLPSPQQVIEFYRSIAAKGEQILSVHITSKLSGTFDAVQMAARELTGEIDVYPFDSMAGSAALGFMCREARQLDLAGKTIQDIIQRLEQIRQKLTLIFTVDNLDFARFSGRVSALQSIFSSVLKIKPTLVLKEGSLELGDKVFTRQRSLDSILDAVKLRVGEQKVRLAIVHAADLETAREMVKKAKRRLNVKEIFITDLAIPVAANLGPGTIGIVAIPEGGKS
jgi:DegV family protein with EDD domain